MICCKSVGERALVSSYNLSIVTFPLSLRVSEILPLFCSSTPLFLTPPPVSSKFPPVLQRIGGWPLGCVEGRCLANCPCNYCPRFPTLCDPDLIHQRHRRTVRQTDGRTTCDHKTELGTIVHHAVKTY